MEYWTLKSLKTLAASCICCLLIACGGGGGSSTDAGMAPTSGSSPDPVTDNSSPSNNPDLPDLELSWLMPDAREDGADLYAYEIAGYHIYYTSSEAPMEQADVITIDDGQITDYSFTDLPSGDYRLAIATVDSMGIEGALSGEIAATIP